MKTESEKAGFSREAQRRAIDELRIDHDDFDISKHQEKAFSLPDWAWPIPEDAVKSDFFIDGYSRIIRETIEEDGETCLTCGRIWLNELSYLQVAMLTHEGLGIKDAIATVKSNLEKLNLKYIFWSESEAISRTMVFLIERGNLDRFKMVLDFISDDYEYTQDNIYSEKISAHNWQPVFSALLRYAAAGLSGEAK